MISKISTFLAYANILVAAGPLSRRKVDQLNLEAFEEAHPRDETATRAFSNVHITTGDGRCLFVDLLSGDFRANLNPLQVAECGTTDGQGWDAIVSGVHNNQPGTTLLVSTLTQACVSFDPRRAAGSQVHLFSCGGRAAGEGEVTNSQLFAFNGLAASQALSPENAEGQCLTVNGDVVDIAACDAADANQSFTYGGAAAASAQAPGDVAEGVAGEGEAEGGAEEVGAGEGAQETGAEEVMETATAEEAAQETMAVAETPEEEAAGDMGGNGMGRGKGNGRGGRGGRGKGRGGRGKGRGRKGFGRVKGAAGGRGRGRGRGKKPSTDCGTPGVATVMETVVVAAEETPAAEAPAEVSAQATAVAEEEAAATNDAATEVAEGAEQTGAQEEDPAVTEAPGLAGISDANPTEPVPVSRAGGTLNPTAAAEAHEFDETATRAFTGVQIRSPEGKCLFVDPTAGDFRQNLIPVQLVDCTGAPNELFDVVTAGKHNNAQGAALIVSSLMNGCISFDGRRQAGDTVTVFSCGGRAAGEGETDTAQIVPFDGETELELAPVGQNGKICLVDGEGRLDSAPCANDGSQVFTIG